MKRKLTALILAALTVMAVFAPHAAFAADDFVTTGSVEVQVNPVFGGDKWGAIIVCTLPDSQSLPARVRLPLPPGYTVQWAGQIMGADAAQDKEVSAEDYTIAGAKDAPYIEFTLTDSRIAQVEVTCATTEHSADHVTSLKGSVSNVWGDTNMPFSLTVVLPAGATNPKMTPAAVGEPQTDQSGQQLYKLNVAKLGPNQKLDIEVSYAGGEDGGAANSGSGSQSTPQTVNSGTVVLVVLIVGAIAVAIIMIAKRAAARRREEDQYYEDDGYDDSDE